MGKTVEYPAEFKLKAIKMYLEGSHGGYQKVAEIFGMKDTRCLRKWVKQYQEYGEEFFKNKKVGKNLLFGSSCKTRTYDPHCS